MANKPKHLKPSDEDVRTAESLIKVGRQELESVLEKMRRDLPVLLKGHEALGGLKRGRAEREFGKLLDVVVLYKCKQNKTYREIGLTHETFCAAAGYSERTMDSWLIDLHPVLNDFSAGFADYLGLTFNEIRLLGRGVSAGLAEIKGGMIEYKGTRIPLSSVGDVIADINADMTKLKEDGEKERRALQRNLGDKERKIQKLHGEIDELDNKLQVRAKAREMTPREDQFLALMDERKTSFRGYMLTVEPTTVDLAQEDSALMRAAYLETLGNMRRQIVAAYDTAVEMFGHDMALEGESWKPGA